MTVFKAPILIQSEEFSHQKFLCKKLSDEDTDNLQKEKTISKINLKHLRRGVKQEEKNNF